MRQLSFRPTHHQQRIRPGAGPRPHASGILLRAYMIINLIIVKCSITVNNLKLN